MFLVDFDWGSKLKEFDSCECHRCHFLLRSKIHSVDCQEIPVVNRQVANGLGAVTNQMDLVKAWTLLDLPSASGSSVFSIVIHTYIIIYIYLNIHIYIYIYIYSRHEI